MSRWVTDPDVPSVHFISRTHHFDTPCGYNAEPYEVAQQSFATDPTQVTCFRCKDFVDRTILGDAERRLGGEARRKR